MRKPTLYSDCDGVLFNSIDIAYEIMRELGCNMQDRNEIDYFFRKVIDWNYVFKRAQIINGGINKLKILKESGLFEDVKILTAISGNYSEEGIKRELFADCAPGIDVITVQYGLVKASVVPNPQFNMLVDDEPRYCKAWNRYGKEDTAVLFVPSQSNVDENIVNDLLDIPNTKAYKKLIKTSNF